ncbi:MAG: hypothetical protein J0L80_02335 [Chitinophagales bacterium]|nr:hypothetical protein [Chitinophagales bacterium]
MKAQQSSNLHKTVIHGKNNSATMPVVNHSHTEKTMPKNEIPDLGYWTGRVIIFDDFFKAVLPRHDRDKMNHGVGVSSYDYKQWTENDIRVIATAFNSLEMFESLVLLKDAAGSEPNGKLTEKDIADAQKALDFLKPNQCKSWKSFYNMIVDVEEATEADRAVLKQRKQEARNRGKSGALMDLNKFGDIAGDPMDVLDQQKALELLDKNAVKMDDEHSLKSPDPKAIALDVVKNIKGAVRAA